MRVFLALMFAFMANAASAQTPPPLTTAYETSWSPPDRRHDAEAVAWFMSGMKFEGEFKIWYLLGEPVVNCTARWTNSTGGFVSLRADDGVMTETAGDGEVEVYNLILTAAWPDPRDTSYGVGSARTIAVPCDAGVVAQNGRSGFNVAGSPSWDKFLCALPDAGIRLKHADDDVCRAMGGKWLDTASAKEVARKGLIISNRGGRALGPAERAHDDVSVSVLKGDVSGMAVMKRVEKRLWREKSAAFKLERAKAYFADFPSRNGEGTASWSGRKNDAMRRMPDLPSEKPTTDQLQAYEAAWQALIAEHGAGAKFEKDWRATEKALVGAQLKRLRNRDAATAGEENAFLRYFADLQKRKEIEPVPVDPMADYRTDDPLVKFSDKRLCGFKTQDGRVVIPAQFTHCRVMANGYALYVGRASRIDEYGQNFYGNSGCGPYGSPECAILYDQGGRVLMRVDGDHANIQSSDSLIQYGLISHYYYDGQNWGRYYSLPEGRFLTEYLKGFRTEFAMRRDRPVAVYRDDTSESYAPCGYSYGFPEGAYRYFFFDTERFEETGVCILPGKDPLNTSFEDF